MNPPLPIDGVLPPDLQGTLVRIGPGTPGGRAEDADPAGAAAGAGAGAGALHAIEIRDGAAVSYLTAPSSADANVFWHAGKVLALAESGLPQQFSRLLTPEEFEGGLRVPIASHVRRDAATGGRVLFGVERGTEEAPPFLRIGEWDAAGALVRHREVELERATWQHDIGVTADHIVFIESPTEFSEALYGHGTEPDEEQGSPDVPVPFRWDPGAPGWIGLLDRAGAMLARAPVSACGGFDSIPAWSPTCSTPTMTGTPSSSTSAATKCPRRANRSTSTRRSSAPRGSG